MQKPETGIATNSLQRRWYQFSLRTLFVLVTLFGLWLGWEVYGVRQRMALIEQLHGGEPLDGRVAFDRFDQQCKNWYLSFDNSKFSWYRKLLGDHFLTDAHYYDGASPEETSRVKERFPEANVQHLTIPIPLFTPPVAAP